MSKLIKKVFKENKDLALIFFDFADFLESEGENPHRIRAYRKAAKSISSFPKNLLEIDANIFDFKQIKNVGKVIERQIKDIIIKGKLPQKQHGQVTPIIKDNLYRIRGLGPKRIKLLKKKLNIKNKKDFEIALENNKLLAVPGFSTKIINKIKNDLSTPKEYRHKFKLYKAIPSIQILLKNLHLISEIVWVECVNQYRRRMEVIDKIDLLIITNEKAKTRNKILKIPQVREILEENPHHLSVILSSGLRADFHLGPAHFYGINLIYLTGNDSHIKKLEQRARARKLISRNENLFPENKALTNKTEKQIYDLLNLDYIEPELRENRGEIAAAEKSKLPKLISIFDIKGDLHCHTDETDGIDTLEEMARKAALLGYEYLAITDHSQNLKITNGLDKKRLLKQIKLIDKLNEKLNNITILKSIEVDILKDGTLDLPNSILKELDLCICSIHSYFKLDQKTQTERIIRAMDNPYFTILGHATGRIINFRNPYAIDIERLFYAAKERNCFIELNAQPSRLDINDIYCQLAKKIGVKIAISTDAHSIKELDFMQFGINQARRGWLSPEDVINTRNLLDLRKILKRIK